MNSFFISDDSTESGDSASLHVLLLKRRNPFMMGTSYLVPFQASAVDGARRPAHMAVLLTACLRTLPDARLGWPLLTSQIGSDFLETRPVHSVQTGSYTCSASYASSVINAR